jgi:hypothetical protein
MNTTETTPVEFTNTETYLIITNCITAGIAFLSEIMGASNCKQNGIIDAIKNICSVSNKAVQTNFFKNKSPLDLLKEDV